MSSSRFTVTYRITIRDGRSVNDHADDICLEQTVETPLECLTPLHHKLGILGRVEMISAVGDIPNTYDVNISFLCDVTAYTIPQFLNTLYGNISIKNNIRILGIDMPEEMLRSFGGPGLGIEGVRRLAGVNRRPLTCTALKPLGLPSRDFAKLAGEFARAGVDMIKDDHGIGDQRFHPFEERVACVQDELAHVYGQTGRRTYYLPMISGRFDQIEAHVEFAIRHDVRGILIAPMLVGPDTMRYVSQTYGLMTIAHPAFAGTFFHDPTHGIPPAMLLGTLFRLFGADVSIFPNFGGRFPFTRQECLDLAGALRRPWGAIKPALPCPAGGMSLDRIPSMATDYGIDTVVLIGGALLLKSGKVEETARRFMNAVREEFGEELVAQEADLFVRPPALERLTAGRAAR